VLGIMPSTVALYTIARKTARGEEEIPVFRTFWRIYRREFIRANGLGAILLAVGLLWYFNLHFFRAMDGFMFELLGYFMMIVGIVFFMMLAYLFPVYVHFDLKLMQNLKQAIMIGFLQPANLVLLVISMLCAYYFLIYLPGLIPLVGISLLAHLNMWISFQCFKHIDQMRVKHEVGLKKGVVKKHLLEM
jgi:uncharacterized membrane protein YesL